jgi:hypothetical protein
MGRLLQAIPHVSPAQAREEFAVFHMGDAAVSPALQIQIAHFHLVFGA